MRVFARGRLFSIKDDSLSTLPGACRNVVKQNMHAVWQMLGSESCACGVRECPCCSLIFSLVRSVHLLPTSSSHRSLATNHTVLQACSQDRPPIHPPTEKNRTTTHAHMCAVCRFINITTCMGLIEHNLLLSIQKLKGEKSLNVTARRRRPGCLATHDLLLMI